MLCWNRITFMQNGNPVAEKKRCCQAKDDEIQRLRAELAAAKERDCGTEDDVCLKPGDGYCQSCTYHSRIVDEVDALNEELAAAKEDSAIFDWIDWHQIHPFTMPDGIGGVLDYYVLRIQPVEPVREYFKRTRQEAEDAARKEPDDE